MTGAAGSADLADNGKHHVLGRDTDPKGAVHAYQHVFHLLRNQALGRQHMFHFRRPDTVGQRAKGAVRSRMGITANNCHARQRGTLLRPNHMHNALPRIIDTVF